IPGLLFYRKGEPIAWCSVGLRSSYALLERSKILRPVDVQEVWSIVCFFIKPQFRRQGLMVQLLRAIIAHVKSRGGQIIEAYPIEPRKKTFPSVFAWPGFASAYRKAGFLEVARRSETRPIVRYFL